MQARDSRRTAAPLAIQDRDRCLSPKPEPHALSMQEGERRSAASSDSSGAYYHSQASSPTPLPNSHLMFFCPSEIVVATRRRGERLRIHRRRPPSVQSSLAQPRHKRLTRYRRGKETFGAKALPHLHIRRMPLFDSAKGRTLIARKRRGLDNKALLRSPDTSIRHRNILPCAASFF